MGASDGRMAPSDTLSIPGSNPQSSARRPASACDSSGASSLLKKGTGTSRNAVFGSMKAAWLGASPLLQQAPGVVCPDPPAWSGDSPATLPRDRVPARSPIDGARVPCLQIRARRHFFARSHFGRGGGDAGPACVPWPACPSLSNPEASCQSRPPPELDHNAQTTWVAKGQFADSNTGPP